MNAPTHDRDAVRAILEAAKRAKEDNADDDGSWTKTTQWMGTLAAMILGLLWLYRRYQERRSDAANAGKDLSPEEIRARREQLLLRFGGGSDGNGNHNGVPSLVVGSKQNDSNHNKRPPSLVVSAEKKDKYSSRLIFDNNNTEGSTTTTPATIDAAVTKTPKSQAPPAEQLCQALSNITQSDITVVSGPTSWGGQGWTKQRKFKASPKTKTTTTTPLELPLLQYSPFSPASNQPDTMPCWNELAMALESWLMNDNNGTELTNNHIDQQGGDGQTWIHRQLFTNPRRHRPLLATTGLARANAWFVRTRTHIQTANHKNNNNHGLGRVLQVFQRHLVQVVAREWHVHAVRHIQKQQQQQQHLEHNDDDDQDHGLFSEDYIGPVVATMPTDSSQHSDQEEFGIWDDLLSILSDDQCMTYLSKPFVDAVMTAVDDSNNQDNLSSRYLLQELLRQLPSLPDESKLYNGIAPLDVHAVRRVLSSLTNWCSLAPTAAARALAEDTVQALSFEDNHHHNNNTDGRQWENQCMMKSLLVMAAYTVPHFAKLRQQHQQPQPPIVVVEWLPSHHHAVFCESLQERYPMALARRRGRDITADHATVAGIQQVAQSIMRQSRQVAALAMRRMSTYKPASAADSNGSSNITIRKGGLFDWLGRLVRSNEPLMDILQSDLLSPEGLQQQCSTGPFLVGTTTALLSLCGKDLSEHFGKLGHAAFDVRFLTQPCTATSAFASNGHDERVGALGICSRERRLLASTIVTKKEPAADPIAFSGITECFFLTAALLRVGLFATLRRFDEYHTKHRHEFDIFYEMARQEDIRAEGGNSTGPSPNPPAHVMERFGRRMSVQMGWQAVESDPEFLSMVTKYSILQLEWLCAKQAAATRDLEMVPEWFLKLPAQWLARYCTKLSRHEGETAVRIATQLLQSGTKGSHHFSPQALTELIRIAGAFITAGVRRAKAKVKVSAKGRQTSIQGGQDTWEVIESDRNLDIYSSFDSKDLGVTVFSNPFVLNNLAPTLITTFCALDAVEGIDAERENHFDKFIVKNEVADILLWLFHHPSGVPFKSVTEKLDDIAFSRFGSSIAAALCMNFDNAYLSLVDIQDIGGSDPRYAGYLDMKSNAATQGSMCSRRLLMLLCVLTKNIQIAAVLGGNPKPNAACDLASVFIHLLDTLICEDGSLQSNIIPGGTAEYIEKMNYEGCNGFSLGNVSVMLHQLLALGARWHFAAADKGNRSSQFLDALATDELCNIAKLRNAFERFVKTPNDVQVDIASASSQDGSAPAPTFGASSRSRRNMAGQDTMTHEQVNEVSCSKDIQVFLDDLDAALSKKTTSAVSFPRWGDGAVGDLETKVLSGVPGVESDYEDALGDSVVSSSSFQAGSSAATKFAHSFDAAARTKSLEGIGSGKTLVKEAKRCTRLLPTPNSNASIFVCFAEERMDLARAIIVGAEGPYMNGLFEFDVFFPASFPNVPPLVEFKTTGGGKTRVSANLYNDGKVCISLLGTTTAWNESQRWDPATSSLAQVLLSIQTQILGEADPFFSEGFGHGGLSGTPAGEKGSTRLNNAIRLHTLKYCVVEMIKNPPKGFEEVVKRHFGLIRRRVLVQARQWVMSSAKTPLYPRFQKVYCELVVLLSELPGELPTLPPIDADLKELESMDPLFFECHQGRLETTQDEEEQDTKPPAHQALDSQGQVGVDFNPWAGGGNAAAVTTRSFASAAGSDDDEDLYS